MEIIIMKPFLLQREFPVTEEKKMTDMKLKAQQDKKIKKVWVVEFVYYVNGEQFFQPTKDKGGEYTCFATRKEALENKDFLFHGHTKDLRVRKYIREDCVDTALSLTMALKTQSDINKKLEREIDELKEQADRYKPPIGESFKHITGI